MDSVIQAIVRLMLVGVLCPPAFGMNPALDINRYAHKAWTVRDGFFKARSTRLRKHRVGTSGWARSLASFASMECEASNGKLRMASICQADAFAACWPRTTAGFGSEPIKGSPVGTTAS